MLKVYVLSSLLLLSSHLYSDTHNGKVLFNQQDCLKCHGLSQFSPKENKITNFEKLYNRVESCSFGNKTGWFDDEVMDVSSYLNADFYHFKEPPREED